MKRLDKGVTSLKQRTSRQAPFGNMYLQEPDFTPDYYDSIKVAEASNKVKRRVQPYVNMKKQGKRDFKELHHSTDFYRNV